ncbi:ABC-type glycerol-3-phosphate transport system, substrate-binding protein [Leifsonia sp. 98AMF]|uniref:ABC transporter substrate-binding protein n=1 Tax=unclassified Leifsonia TaxID=2663824 RepID=UPI00087A91A6|nr:MULTISPECIES: ABC transporter substrate-binding protein [unclassified Leifsonia]SDH60655.1 ABC-type glycerol-3-phosphate transport system, substrate-binding protein [Leifsonia sp. 197AMF]SDI78462.1 ABC-type glycerol-3-phosphate transport system, substrate-binding protein [Leifsonia sp. 466MF]SDK07751.1 ABC-type glycerol-3-phosphate transport system, substrate-binding protein [Leifsonia sp. 157MF]SDN81995.1 ABC-type glycerol-3-phosphate transport system, substrate-binding protein [Leifsonia s
MVLAAGATVAAAALLLTGCSGSSPAATPSATAEKNVHLTFLNQSRGQEAVLNELAKKYGEDTGVTVTIDTPGPVDYLPKLQADAQSKQMPDIYSSFNPVSMAPFYKAGWALDLTKDLKGDWSKNFTPEVIKLATFAKGNNLGVKPGIYTVHWENQAYGLISDSANSGITASTPPKTVSDLIKQLAASNKNPNGGFSVAASLTPQFVQYLASNWLTDKQINDTFAGDYKWTSDGWAKAFQVIADLKKAGAIQGGSIPGGSTDNPTVETNFFTKHSVGTIFDASPGVSVAHKTAPDYTAFFSLSLPKASDAKYSPRSPGVPGKGAVINPRGQHVQASLDFVKWLTQPAQQAVFAKEAYIIPTSPSLLSGSKLPDTLTGFAAAAKNQQVIPNTFSAQVTDAINRDVQSLVLGQMTVKDLLADVQNAQDASQ